MVIGDSLQLLESHEQLGIPITVESVANVKIADPLRGNQNEEIDDQPLIEAVQNIICDPTEAKLPNSWKWCSVSEEYQEDDPIAYSKITAVRFGVVNQITMPIKMLTVVGEEVFYTVRGVVIKTPSFLPKSYSTVGELNDILIRFDSANICSGFKLPCKDALTPSLKKATVKQLGERRSKFCLRILQKGSTCYRCEHLNKLVAGMSPKPSQMERLVERSQKSSNQNRLLKLQLRRKAKVIKVKNVN